jgi:hypothetical protein
MANETNSASSWTWLKFHYGLAFFMFWFTVPGVAGNIAQFIVGVPHPAEVSSAFLYMLNGLLFIYWANRKLVPQWLPLPMACAAASVLLLKWDSPILLLIASLSWLYVWGSMLHGLVFPWQMPARLLFVSSDELNRIVTEAPKES